MALVFSMSPPNVVGCGLMHGKVTPKTFIKLVQTVCLLGTMAIGTGGQGGGGAIPHQIFCQPKKLKSLKIMTYKSIYSNMANIGS